MDEVLILDHGRLLSHRPMSEIDSLEHSFLDLTDRQEPVACRPRSPPSCCACAPCAPFRYVALGVLAIVALLAAMQTRHGGRTSWPKSAMRLTPPIRRTPRVSQRSGMGAGCVSNFVFTAETTDGAAPPGLLVLG